MNANTYYNPNDKVNPDGVRVEPSWPSEVRQIQRKMLLDRGYLPLIENGTEVQTPFEVSYSTIQQKRDLSGNTIFVRTWTTKKVEIHMSMEKMARYLQSKGLLEDFMKRIYSDSSLTDWWLNKRTYIRGEKKHKTLCQRLGISENVMEDMAMKCREIRSAM